MRKTCLLLLIVVMLFAAPLPVEAATRESSVGITFTAPPPAPKPKPDRPGGGTSVRDTDPPRRESGNFEDLSDEVVWVVNPATPLTHLGTLPATGSNWVYARALISVGVLLLAAHVMDGNGLCPDGQRLTIGNAVYLKGEKI